MSEKQADTETGWDPQLMDAMLAHVERTDVQIDDTVVTNIVRLAQYFLADFIPHGHGQWLALEDKMDLVRIAMRGVNGLASAVERNNVTLSDETISVLVHAMAGFSAVVYTWMDTLHDDVRAHASQLYMDTTNKIVFLLRVLGGHFPKDIPPAGHIARLRNLLCGNVEVASSSLPLSYSPFFRLSFPGQSCSVKLHHILFRFTFI